MSEPFRWEPRAQHSGGTHFSNERLPDPGDDSVPSISITRRFVGILIDYAGPWWLLLILGDNLATLVPFAVLANSVWLQGRTGASVGKQIMGLRLAYIPYSDGGVFVVPGVSRCLLRFCIHPLDCVLLIGFLKALFNRYGRSFADVVARTMIIQDDSIKLMTQAEYVALTRRGSW